MAQKDEKQWKLDLMALVDKEGGTLENGWEVKVKRRQSGEMQIPCSFQALALLSLLAKATCVFGQRWKSITTELTPADPDV